MKEQTKKENKLLHEAREILYRRRALHGKTLILTIGLPCSGKTSWALQQGCPVVNKDAIRLALHGRYFERLSEPFVAAITRTMIHALFHAGHDTVILDDCNILQYERQRLEDLEWAVKEQIFDTSPGVCKGRAIAAEKDEMVGVINRLASWWPVQVPSVPLDDTPTAEDALTETDAVTLRIDIPKEG